MNYPPCTYTPQSFAQIQLNFAPSHNGETVTFRNSVSCPTVEHPTHLGPCPPRNTLLTLDLAHHRTPYSPWTLPTTEHSTHLYQSHCGTPYSPWKEKRQTSQAQTMWPIGGICLGPICWKLQRTIFSKLYVGLKEIWKKILIVGANLTFQFRIPKGSRDIYQRTKEVFRPFSLGWIYAKRNSDLPRCEAQAASLFLAALFNSSDQLTCPLIACLPPTKGYQM